MLYPLSDSTIDKRTSQPKFMKSKLQKKNARRSTFVDDSFKHFRRFLERKNDIETDAGCEHSQNNNYAAENNIPVSEVVFALKDTFKQTNKPASNSQTKLCRIRRSGARTV